MANHNDSEAVTPGFDGTKSSDETRPQARPLGIYAPDAAHAAGVEGTPQAVSDPRLIVDDKEKEIAELKAQLSMTQALLSQKESQLNQIFRTPGWRLLSRYGEVKHRYLLPVYRRLKKLAKRRAKDPYADWARTCEQYRFNPESAARHIERFHYLPLVSIIMPVYNPQRDHLLKAIDSVRRQYYPRWELCICDDASTAPHVREVLAVSAAADERIKVVFAEANNGISAASNRALTLATGEFVGLLDHDDELTPDALYEVAATLQESDADLIYSDEDKLDERGRRCEPFFKPAWTPDLLLSTMYICHFGVYRRRIVDEIGGFRGAFDGSQDYDLALRFTERTRRIVHIPKILYHWRKVATSAAGNADAKPYAYDAGRRALADALHRRAIQGTVEPGVAPGFYRVRRQTRPEKVSIIIPTRDRLNLLRACVESIESKTDYKSYEILIVDNGSHDEATLDYLKQSRHRVLRCDGPFNFSRLNNLAAREADGDYLLFLNNDTQALNTEWLSAMVEHAQRPEVGAVGAKLLYPNGSIQHAGVILGPDRIACHPFRRSRGGYFNFPDIQRNYSAVTAACLMVRRALFKEVGGLNEEALPVTYNDVDFCLRLRQRGYLIVYTPYARLVHRESASRRLAVDANETAFMMATWHRELIDDPYYNPSLNASREDLSIDLAKPDALCRTYSHEPTDKRLSRLDAVGVAAQEFFSSADKLCAIGIDCEATGRGNAGVVRLHLREATQRHGEDIRVAEISAAEISGRRHCLFAFDPIPDSGGKRFSFSVEFVNPSPDFRLRVWKSHAPGGASHLGAHQSAADALAFSAYCLKQFR